METFLFYVYQFFSVVMFLFLSALLIYSRLFARWLKFSVGFFIVYVLGSYFFFGRLPLPEQVKEHIQAMPLFLFLLFCGTAACIGIGLVKEMTWRQIIGAVLFYQFVLCGVFLFSMEPVHALFWIRVASLVALALGLPAVIGYSLLNEFGFGRSLGVAIVFLVLIALGIAAIELTIGYKPTAEGSHSRPWLFSSRSD